MSIRASLSLTALVLAAAGPIAGAACAQEAQGAISLDTITVEGESATGPVRGYVAQRGTTGSKTGTPLAESAQSVSVITRDQLTQQSAQSLNEALRYSPGVTTESRGAGASRFDQFKIRGFDSVSYLNGLRMQKMNWVSPQVDPYLLERVEVLRGPSSVLYGQAPTGGMVNQISKLPTLTRFGEVGVQFGNNQQRQASFDVGGPIDKEGRFLYRLTGIGRMENGQIAHTEAERLAIAPAFTFRPSEDTSLTLLGLYQREPKANAYVGVPAVGSVVFNRNGRLSRRTNVSEPNLETFDRTQASAGYLFSHRFNDTVTLRMNGQWFRSDIDYFSVFGTSLAANGRTLSRSVSLSHDEMDALAFDNQLEWKFNTGPLSHTLLTGFDAQYSDGYFVNGTGPAPAIDMFAPVYGRPITLPATRRTDQTTRQYGLYAQDEIRFGNFIATFAGRSDWARTKTTVAGVRSEMDDHALTGRAALLYRFDNGIAPYVSFAQSFTPLAGTDAAGRAFDPERGVQYEAGIKYQPVGINALFSAAVFDLTRENLLTTDLANPGRSVQVGEARSRGVELEAKASLDFGLNVAASYTYLDTKYTRDNSGLQGLVPTGVPRHMASLWLYYELPANLVPGLSVGAGVRYVGSTFNTNNTIEVPSATLVDATLRYDFGKLMPQLKGMALQLNVKNLFDKEYVGACYTSTLCSYGQGRVVTAGLNYRW